jgi:hypothetical protein
MLETFRRELDDEEDDIVIDFTGGQKPTSVAAVAITFNRKVRAQYVDTNHPDQPPIGYTVAIERADFETH